MRGIGAGCLARRPKLGEGVDDDAGDDGGEDEKDHDVVKDVEDEAVQDLRHTTWGHRVQHRMGAPYRGTVWDTIGHHARIAVLCSLLHTTARYDSLPLTTTHYYSLLLTTTHYYDSLPLAHLAIVDLRVVGVLCEGEVPYRPLAEAVIPVEEGEERQVGLVPWCTYE